MSTGRPDGDYHRYGLEYRKILAQQGVDLELVTSDGALENIGRLMDPSSRVDVAFFQSGTGFAANAPHVESLGTLYYEPLWVFYRGAPISDLHELNGKRIAIGPEQSGTRPLALQLLAVNLAVMPPTELLPMPGEQAAGMLERGELDALFHVAPADSPLVQRLIAGQRRAAAQLRPRAGLRPALPLSEQRHFAAWSLRPRRQCARPRHRAAVPDREPAGPRQPAPCAGLPAHERRDHRPRRGLPAERARPVSRLARRRLPVQRGGGALTTRSGEPWLQRYLPYWAAVLVDRLWVLVLPFLAVVVPLSRLLPQLYAWRMRSRLYRWYGRLKEIELELEDKPAAEELEAMLQRLDEIEAAVSHIAHAARLLRESVQLPQQYRPGAGAGAEGTGGARG